MALVTYLIDKMDIFGVIKIEETKYVLISLEGDIQETLKRCENVTEEMYGFLLPA
jgi:RecA-family ATPase